MMRTPLVPSVVPAPLIARFRRVITSFEPALMITPWTPLDRMPPAFGPPSMVMPLVMVTAPKPPGSRASITPPGAVFEIAPANVLHGAVRLHGLTSSPTPETHVRVACAAAGVAASSRKARRASKRTHTDSRRICTADSLSSNGLNGESLGRQPPFFPPNGAAGRLPFLHGPAFRSAGFLRRACVGRGPPLTSPVHDRRLQDCASEHGDRGARRRAVAAAVR